MKLILISVLSMLAMQSCLHLHKHHGHTRYHCEVQNEQTGEAWNRDGTATIPIYETKGVDCKPCRH